MAYANFGCAKSSKCRMNAEFAADMLSGAVICKVSEVKLKYQTRRIYLY